MPFQVVRIVLKTHSGIKAGIGKNFFVSESIWPPQSKNISINNDIGDINVDSYTDDNGDTCTDINMKMYINMNRFSEGNGFRKNDDLDPEWRSVWPFFNRSGLPTQGGEFNWSREISGRWRKRILVMY